VKSGQNETILILEAGDSDRSPFIKFPAGQIRAIAHHDWGYRCQPDPSRNGALESWLSGRVLGGSSSINGTMYVRGAAEDFNRWAQHREGYSTVGWSADDVMPIFRELECSDQSGSLRGHSGRVHVRTVKHPHPVTEAFLSSAQACGYPLNEDYNDGTQDGVGYAQLSQHRGLRCSAADAFLKPILGRKSVELLLNAAVQKIEFADGRATAVCFSANKQERRETAREIIVCAGAINTPKLLMLSGIGDAEELGRHNIDVVVDSPGVGRHLKEHPLLKLTYRTKISTYSLTGGALQKLSIAAKFAVFREGPISNIFEAAAFLKSSASEATPDIQLHFLPVGYLTKPNGSIELASYPSVTVLLNKSRPKSFGRLRLASSAPADPPLIECRLLDDQADVDTMVQGIGITRRLMQTQPIARLIEEEIAPGAGVQSVAALTDYVRNYTGIAYHAAGTCRMGSDSGAVVDPSLRVRGIENLWIADASIMPDLISGNTNAVCMMIGMKLGKQLTSRRSRRNADH